MQTNEMGNLGIQLEQMRRQNRRMKWGMATLTLAVVAGFAAQNRAELMTAADAQPDAPPPIIEAQRLVIKDAKGQTWATFGPSEYGVRLAMNDKTGRQRVNIYVSEFSSTKASLAGVEVRGQAVKRDNIKIGTTTIPIETFAHVVMNVTSDPKGDASTFGVVDHGNRINMETGATGPKIDLTQNGKMRASLQSQASGPHLSINSDSGGSAKFPAGGGGGSDAPPAPPSN